MNGMDSVISKYTQGKVTKPSLISYPKTINGRDGVFDDILAERISELLFKTDLKKD
jgi:hypothetical protein